jgi:penicillin amidase
MTNRRAFLLTSAALFGVQAAQAFAKPAGSAPAKRVSAPGAGAAVEIIEDRWGIPHIRAKSKADAYFGQGYVVARDRLFQIDLARRRGLGQLAEAFGPKFVAHDHSARLFQYRDDVEAELASLPPEVLACAKGYVAGVNARLAELEADPTLLPQEYAIFGIRPLHWDVRDFVIMRSPSVGNIEDEIRRSKLAVRGLLDQDLLVDPLRPAHAFLIPDGLDPAQVSDADLGLLAVAERPLPFSKELALYQPHVDRIDLLNEGSNGWTVSPSRTATGRPILANDPHLGIGGAAPRHVAHLTAPGLDVIGGGAPGLPGIMQGHTDRFAFGRTNFHIDQEDLFILVTKPGDPDSYWHGGVWKKFRKVEEIIKVKGGADQAVTLRYAENGPVISEDPARNRATSVAAVWMRSGANAPFAQIAINLATDWASLTQAVKLHVSPTNLHYADIEGNTGWHSIGHAPIRPAHDGLLPAPGDGRYDWTGIQPIENMANVYNPEKGWFATANQMNLPEDYPADRIMSFSWRDSYRYDRIAEVLKSQPKHTLADSAALQHDTVAIPARELVPLLPHAPSPQAAPAAALLRDWDFSIAADSAAAAVYELTWQALNKGFLETVVPAGARDLIKSVNASELLRLLKTPDARFGADPLAARDALIDGALASGWTGAVHLLGADPAKWRWGDLHRVTISHPLSQVPVIAAAFPRIEGGGSGGDAYTVMARWVNPSRGYNVTGGASYLMVVDVGAWDNTRMLNLPGQSADPRSPHYQDFYQPWLKGDMQPLLFSPKAVNAQAAARTVLEPKGS